MITQTVKSAFDAVTYCLIAFVAISLVVSGIMIGIMTGISVAERTREIGILRAIGASGGSICHIFNAENIFIGAASGVLGVAVTILLISPINSILAQMLNTQSLSARLQHVYALILIVLSIVITVLGGLVPALMATRKDPVKTMQD
jgi:putative ABC transport system permease protein